MALGKQVAPTANLDAFMDWAERDGARLSEHPAHGGVHVGAHKALSWHADGKAVDVNWGEPGAPPIERVHASHGTRVARWFGLGVIYARDGVKGSAAHHQDHLHADVGSTFNVGLGLVKFSTAPRLAAYRLQVAVRAERDNRWGDDTDKRLGALRAASKFGGVEFPFSIAFTQKVVGADPTGVWDPESRAAHDRAVAAVQRALGLAPSGVWSPATEHFFRSARSHLHH
jgi:hypothetical protein